jgi:hypothetical protein
MPKNFFPKARQSDGKVYPVTVKETAKVRYRRKLRARNVAKGLTINGQPRKTQRVPYKNGSTEHGLFLRAKARSKEKGLPFALTAADIIIPNFCPILGIPLQRGVGKVIDGSPSLDRIDSTLGYVPGNVQVISYRANTLKNSATRDEILLMAQWAEQYMPAA